ncbi:killer cell immunoglobulin-like receptor 3DL1 [Rattus rattus]|uniref:killer cell immunoglobulin-like receptor 3DL1 n=1 Tax=Rattus rattus TaxID=10117 RepID=UPI0013F33D6C|nr:killer cell immunoglobulin-like receptor 3DL1 [Rattus rattus]
MQKTEPYRGFCMMEDNLKNLHIQIGLLVTMVLVFLLLIIIIIYFSYFSKKSKSQKQAGSISEQESKVKATINRQDPERQEEQEVTYIEFEQRIFNKTLMPPIFQSPKEFSIDTVVYTEVMK